MLAGSTDQSCDTPEEMQHRWSKRADAPLDTTVGAGFPSQEPSAHRPIRQMGRAQVWESDFLGSAKINWLECCAHAPPAPAATRLMGRNCPFVRLAVQAGTRTSAARQKS